MGIIQLVERNVNHKILFGEGHVLIHLMTASIVASSDKVMLTSKVS